MQQFVPGQRWISDTELQMGLGTVLKVDFRSVTIMFLATGETRTYAKQSAPLTRVQFVPGDQILSHEGWSLSVTQVDNNNGLITYIGTRDNGESAVLEEGQLDNFIQLNRPTDRLSSGQIDHGKWFELRYQTLQIANQLTHSDLFGLLGGRTSLIPHQLYIAHEVANRFAPRVLLADEVGLGKTIEAGLILHHQILTERASRVLIVVPETLLHQWLVEMIRRFNLFFSVFDEERCLADEESSAIENPFQTEQLVLCSLGFLTQNEKRFKQALEGDWDLLVVDEAHHLQWSPTQVSTEYHVIEQLASNTKGVLLLTATPEQLGKASHFARLRLLDNDRFHDYNTFIEEEKSYQPVAQAVAQLLSSAPLNKESLATLAATVSEGDNQDLLDIIQNYANSDADIDSARQELVNHLLDRHGTGRVLFRNTRAAVKGFPQRKVSLYELPLAPEYAECFSQYQSMGVTDMQMLLSPELLYRELNPRSRTRWSEIDSRIPWLVSTVKELKPEKVLIIVSNVKTALELVEILKLREGIQASVFHEQLTIIERDRAAAYFADLENGAQVLVCSEIGSEGRNFQFAHHLVLFDLPYNPDLLEQRIGRLDRIGQTQTIQIHVPYLQNSPQAIMVHWYHQGLSAFEQTCPAGYNVYTQVDSNLREALHQVDDGLEDLPTLVATTQQLHKELNLELQRGRDRLLEYNSCRSDVAEGICTRARQQDDDTHIQDYMMNVFDCFGIDVEDHSKNSFVLHPGTYMQMSSFPGLNNEGMTVTYDRATALTNEDIHFITWEHPMVSGAMELILTNEQGNTAVTAINHPDVQPGTLLVESLFVLQTAANSALQANRYLPPTTLRILMMGKGKDCSKILSHETINKHQIAVSAEIAAKVVKSQAQEIRQLVAHCEMQAMQLTPEILSAAQQHGTQLLSREIDRLHALRRVNPSVREAEIEFFTSQLNQLTEALEHAIARLDAIRIIVAT